MRLDDWKEETDTEEKCIGTGLAAQTHSLDLNACRKSDNTCLPVSRLPYHYKSRIWINEFFGHRCSPYGSHVGF